MAKVIPHNKSGLDLRKIPVCYLCGSFWVPYQGDLKIESPKGLIVVRCSSTICGLVSYAIKDNEVIDARGWHL